MNQALSEALRELRRVEGGRVGRGETGIARLAPANAAALLDALDLLCRVRDCSDVMHGWEGELPTLIVEAADAIEASR